MKKRVLLYAAWLILACLLYFFENNLGTRIVLACSLLLPLPPGIRRGLFGQDEGRAQPTAISRTVKDFSFCEADDPGDVRPYQPGDPVNRIHWKLSAKRDELLLREQARDTAMEETEKGVISAAQKPARHFSKKNALLVCAAVLLCSLLLLFVIPSAYRGAQALMNRLFTLSEQVNAYAYERFPVPADQPVVWTAVLLSLILLSLLGISVLTGSRVFLLCLIAGCALFQVYFGLAFPAWANVLLFVFFVLGMLRRPWEKKAVLSCLTGIAVVSLLTLLVFPGVDAGTEAASEAIRDRLSQFSAQLTGDTHEQPAGENETRHVHTQSLAAGNQEARTAREYRLITIEEEQIAMPHWINYLKIALLLLLTAALVTLPFVPFVYINSRRKKALEARKAFRADSVNEAVFAIFQHVAAWLEATGNGAGNRPYAQWKTEISERISPEYAERFDQCERLFEEAAYSAHEMRTEQRDQVLALLNETEAILRARADFRQRLRLKYREWLWV